MKDENKTREQLLEQVRGLRRRIKKLEKLELNRKRIEDALRASQRSLRSLAENVPSILMRYDRNLQIVWLSPGVKQMTGLSVEEFIGKTNREAGMPEHLCDLWEGSIEEVFQTGKNRTIEFDFFSKEGKKSFYLKFAPEFGPDSLVQYVLGIFTDITERRQAEEELERYRFHLEELVKERTSELMAAHGRKSMEVEKTIFEVEKIAEEKSFFIP